MQIVVLGAGAVGTLVGALLSKRHSVVLVGRQPHTKAIRENGVLIGGITQQQVTCRAQPDLTGVSPPDLLLVTTKAVDTASALTQAKHVISSDTAVLLLQNGLGLERVARGLVPERQLLRGLTYLGAILAGPGRIVWSATGRTVLGDPAPPSDAARTAALASIAEAFDQCGLETGIAGDIRREVWKKTLGNIGINALGAITGFRNGELVRNAYTSQLMVRLVEEAQCVARTQGYELDSVSHVRDLALATATNKNSMLQDIDRGRRTEIDFLNGAVVSIGERCGVDAPSNHAVTLLVKALELRAKGADAAP